MTRRFSNMLSLGQSHATVSLPRPSSATAFALEQTPLSSRRSSIVMLDQPTHVSSTVKFRPAPLQLGRVSSTSFESYVSVVRGHGRAPTLVLRLSPTTLPSGDMLAAMSTNRINTETIDYISPESIPGSVPGPHSAPLLRFTGEPSGSRSGSPENEGSRSNWNRERSRPSRRTSLPPAVPPLPPNISLTSKPTRSPTPPPLRQSPPQESFIWPSKQADPVLEPDPETSTVTELRPDSDVLGRQRSGRSGRSRRGVSTSTVGDMSIDWIVPENSTTVGRFKGIGIVPTRTTQASMSAAVVRGSITVERQESTTGTLRESASGNGGGGSRRERARRDSGVLGADDLARVRRSVQTII